MGEVLLERETVIVRRDTEAERLAIIEFTREKQLNSFISQQYADLSEALDQLNTDDSIACALLTARGRFYSSGHDLRQQMASQMELSQASPEEQRALLKKMTESNAGRLIQSFIRFDKPLVAAVNGPAVGVACTTLQLCDVIYSVDEATFHVPFMQLGFCAEGCSSLLFPMVMGTSKANEMLLMGKKLNAVEAQQCGFISEHFPAAEFREQVLSRTRRMAKFPPMALRQTKGLMRHAARQTLLETNERELTLLLERFQSEECHLAVMQFVMEQQARKSSKL